jgi:uracil-DNA glycosylase
MDELLAELAAAHIGATFNQYREAAADDLPGAPAVRLANLRHYLGERAGAPVLAVGEAAGYQGMRWSGIAFTSERDLERFGPPYAVTCSVRRWSEPSGTIVHRVLRELDAERRVILWNTVPTHPHQPGRPLSNRRPSVAEIAAGAAFVERALTVLRPVVLVAVGRVAESVLGDRAAYVRHPANGGGAAFAAGIRDIIGGL